MRRSLKSSVCAAALCAALPLIASGIAVTKAEAAPIPYVTSVFDTPNATVNQAVASINAQFPEAAVLVTCSGNTTGTCNGLKLIDSVTNLTTTAGGNVSAQVTVTDNLVTAASQLICEVNDYAGTGQPGVANITSNAGNFTFNVQNTTASGGSSLNATVPVNCLVYN